MAERKDIETSATEASVTRAGGDLPAVESPPLSPAASSAAPEAPAITIDPAEAPASLSEATAPAAAAPHLRFVLRPRHKRQALLAASVAIAAALGAVVGAAATGGFTRPPAQTDVAGLEERKAMQQSITRLAKEVTTLKGSVEAANKSAHSQIAKISERLSHESEVTGSISAPQTTTPSAAPLPTPRPAQRVAAVQSAPPARPSVVQGWAIRDARAGFVYVEGNGDVYQVVPGAPLPGLGAVESVRRQDGRWVVVTPKGLIVSMRDRRYFESF
jgi:hypothetical protein